jgi:hypothetical protein
MQLLFFHHRQIYFCFGFARHLHLHLVRTNQIAGWICNCFKIEFARAIRITPWLQKKIATASHPDILTLPFAGIGGGKRPLISVLV